jgi:hypothetical protein
MTVVAVLADPARPGLVFPDLAETSPLSESEVADLYAAMCKDTFRAVARSGGDLLVNYRPDDLLPDEFVTDTASEAAIRTLAVDALDDVGEARFEPQVGSTQSARAGNTITHLLREEQANSAAVVPVNTPMLTRPGVDQAAMKLRRAPVVLGPGQHGDVYYAGFTDTVDFVDCFAPPAIETFTDLASDADHETDFLPMQPTLSTGADLATLLSILRARVEAERIVPEFTTTFLFESGLSLDTSAGTPELVRE